MLGFVLFPAYDLERYSKIYEQQFQAMKNDYFIRLYFHFAR